MGIPVNQDLYCYKGQTFSQNLYFKQSGHPYDLTNYTVKSQVRPSENSKTLIAEFDCSIDTELGRISLYLSNETTAALPDGAYAWDLKTIDGNDAVKYWVRGKFIVSGRVTE